MSDWRDTTLGEFVALQRGHDLTVPQRRNGHVPVMGSAGQNGFHDTALAKGPGIVIGRSGASFGQVHFSKEDFWPHNTGLYVTDFKGNDPLFAFYFLKALDFDRFNSGSAQPSLNRNFIYPIPIRVPKPAEQRAIASVLGSLDDLIEVNREINETLEEVARALFKSWFVDFDPVRAKLEGRPPAGMDAATAALFPDHFQDSELGQIPKGWEVVNVGAIAEQSIGGQWGEDLPAEGLVPAICLRGCDMEDLRKSGNSARAPIRFIKPQALEKRSMQNCDFLIASSGAGPCGRPLWCSPNLQSMHQYEAIYSNFVKRFTAPSRAHAIFLDRLFQEKFDDDSIWDYINGTSVPNLDANGLLGGYKITLPPVAILEAYSDYCIPIFELLYSGESRDLAALRDTLLPKLLSGEVSVSTAEELIIAST